MHNHEPRTTKHQAQSTKHQAQSTNLPPTDRSTDPPIRRRTAPPATDDLSSPIPECDVGTRSVSVRRKGRKNRVAEPGFAGYGGPWSDAFDYVV